jgi:hypothetical protein
MLDRGDIPGCTVIPRVGKRQCLSKQTMKDQIDTTARLRRNAPFLPFVRTRLETCYGLSLQKKNLLIVAQTLPGVVLDRLAKRSRDCLMCWFCENWSIIEPLLASKCSQQPRVNLSDSRNSCVCTTPAKDVQTGIDTAVDENIDDFVTHNFCFDMFETPFGSEVGFDFFDIL